MAGCILLVGHGFGRADEALERFVGRVLDEYAVTGLAQKEVLLRQTGHSFSSRRQSAGTILREVQWPNYLRVDIRYADGTVEERLLVGADGWRDGVSAPEPLVAAMRLQAARLALPMLLAWEADHLRDMGPSTREDGREVRRMAVELDEGITLFVEVDAAEARILRTAGVMSFGGMEMTFGAAYTGWKNYGPVQSTVREDLSAMGNATGWAEVEKIEIDRPVDPEMLRP